MVQLCSPREAGGVRPPHPSPGIQAGCGCGCGAHTLAAECWGACPPRPCPHFCPSGSLPQFSPLTPSQKVPGALPAGDQVCTDLGQGPPQIKCAQTWGRAHPTSPPRLRLLSPWGPQVHREGWGGGLPESLQNQTSLFCPGGWGRAAADPGWTLSMSRPGGQKWLGGLGWASKAVSTVSLHGAPTRVAGSGAARTGALNTRCQTRAEVETPTLSSETPGAPLEKRQGWAPRGWMGDPAPQAQDRCGPLSGAGGVLALQAGSAPVSVHTCSRLRTGLVAEPEGEHQYPCSTLLGLPSWRWQRQAE